MSLRFEFVDQRFETSEHKLLAAFRKELLAAVTAQSSAIGANEDTGLDEYRGRALDGRRRLQRRPARLTARSADESFRPSMKVRSDQPPRHSDADPLSYPPVILGS